MGLVKIWQFTHVFIIGKLDQGNVFQDSLERNKAFLDYKNNKLKMSKNWDFSKGVSPWSWSKIGTFFMLLFQGKEARKMCFTIFWREKTAFRL